MATVRDFWAKVGFTDADGEHPAGTLVRVPYGSDAEIAAAQSMLAYGVLSEQAPASSLVVNEENPVVAETPPPVEAMSLAPNEENAVDETPVLEEPDLSPSVAEDDPETPYFDARDESGKFVEEGTPVEEAPAPKKAPAKRTRKK